MFFCKVKNTRSHAFVQKVICYQQMDVNWHNLVTFNTLIYLEECEQNRLTYVYSKSEE